jgi:hypothetical protein
MFSIIISGKLQFGEKNREKVLGGELLPSRPVDTVLSLAKLLPRK